MARLRQFPVEAVIWAGALVALACTDPNGEGLLSLCVAKAVGLPGCPGCGLGHAIAHLLDGHLAASVQAHPFGVPVVAVLGGRIGHLVRGAFTTSPLPHAAST